MQTSLEFSQVGMGSKLVQDYWQGNPNVLPFYAHEPSLEGLHKAIQHRQNVPVNRTVLVNAFENQYAHIELQDAEKQAIELLKYENTFTVTTGHQLCIFTGPLFFVYKIVSVIRLARDLKQAYPEYNFVPVYWMNSEDHDFEEISSFDFLQNTFKWTPLGETGGPTGMMETASLKLVLDQIRNEFQNLAGYDAILSIMETAYLKHANLTDATRYIAHALFGAYGVLALDQNDALLKREFSTVLVRDVLEQHTDRLTQKTNEQLEISGYSTQIHPREINFFCTVNQKRQRLIVKDGNIAVNQTDIAWTPVEFAAWAPQNLESLSGNVVTRPLYQETILPNIAYVGGPAEVHYWLQLKANFEFYQIPFPVVLMRDSFLITQPKTRKKIEKLGIELADLMGDEEEVIQQFIRTHDDGAGRLKLEIDALQIVYDEIARKLAQVDKSLEGAAKAEQQKALNGLKGLEAKLMRALKQQHEQSIAAIRDIRSKFFPNGNFQERVDSYLSYANRPDFIKNLIAIANPLQPVVKLVHLDD